MDEVIDVKISVERGVSVIGFEGANLSNSEAISAVATRINDYVAEAKPKAVVFDFGGVKFFSSQVLGVLLDIRAKVESNEGRLVISSIDPQLHRVFRITNLDKIFTFYPDKESAVRALSAA